MTFSERWNEIPPAAKKDIEKALIYKAHHAKEELAKDANSMMMAMAALLKIEDKRKKTVPMIVNQAQQRLIEVAYRQHHAGLPIRLIVNKGRQMGISTCIAAFNYIWGLSSPISSLVITNEKGASATNIWSKHVKFDESLRFDRPYKNTRLGHYRDYIDGSSVRISGETKFTSFTMQFCHLSEAPFFQNLDSTLEMVMQSIPNTAGTAVFLESAANEASTQSQDFWEELWDNSQGGLSDFVSVFLAWYDHEEYQLELTEEKRHEIEVTLGTSEDSQYGDEKGILETYPDITLENLAWRRACIRNNCGGSLHTFRRQYPNCPEDVKETSGLQVFNLLTLKKYEPHLIEPTWKGDILQDDIGRFQLLPNPPRTNPSAPIWVWEAPEMGAEYVAGSDHAEGLPSGDFSVGYILRRLPLQVVARLRAPDGMHYSPVQFAKAMFNLLQYYNDAYYNPESNIDGGTIATFMRDAGYTNICDESMFGWRKPGETIPKLGWRSTSKTRKLLFNYAIEMVENESVIIPDKRLLSEMASLRYNNGKPEAAKKSMPRKPGESDSGYYDDCVVAFASALWADYHLPPAMPTSANIVLGRDNASLSTLSVDEVRGLDLI